MTNTFTLLSHNPVGLACCMIERCGLREAAMLLYLILIPPDRLNICLWPSTKESEAL